MRLALVVMLALAGCANDKPFNYHDACGQDDCGKETLAPRPVSFPPIHGDKWYEEFAESFQMTYPGREMWFVKGMKALPEEEFEKVPWVTYRGYTIYAKRLKETP